MNQSDANALYDLLKPACEKLGQQYSNTVGIEFERLIRQRIEQGDVPINLNNSRLKNCTCIQQILLKSNAYLHYNDWYKNHEPVELKHLFAALTYVHNTF